MVAGAICPHPPLLVPEIASGAAGELAALREACDTAIEALLAASPDGILIVGGAPQTRWHEAGATGTFAPYGVDLTVGLDPAGPAHEAPTLPLSLAVGAWLLARHRPTVPVAALSVAADATTATCQALGAHECAPRWPRVALLVMGDGSARRGLKAPGYDDPRARPFDDSVAAALADGDPKALLALDPGLAHDLLAAGRSAWQVLAAAALAQEWRGDLRYADAPYGVGYFAASWTRP